MRQKPGEKGPDFTFYSRLQGGVRQNSLVSISSFFCRTPNPKGSLKKELIESPLLRCLLPESKYVLKSESKDASKMENKDA